MNDKIMFAGKAKEVRQFFESNFHQYETFESAFDDMPEIPRFEYYIEDEMTAQKLIDSCGEELL